MFHQEIYLMMKYFYHNLFTIFYFPYYNYIYIYILYYLNMIHSNKYFILQLACENHNIYHITSLVINVSVVSDANNKICMLII